MFAEAKEPFEKRFIVGVQRRTFRDQDPVNVEACELMGRLHDALKASGYEGHDLERLLVRLVFCLFADHTGIFERDVFLDLVTQRSQADGAETGRLLVELFEVLNTPAPHRQKALDEDFNAFPYVNGALFAERLSTPAFDAAMRALLIEACNFKWDAISPAIFGSLFQSVMNAKERRAGGAHYTTEKNIMKVIAPLFLDEFRDEFERLKARRDRGRGKALKAFHEKLGTLALFDPACGCGNFLVIAYRELRALELDVLKEIFPRDNRVLDVSSLSLIDVNRFYGIEIAEFPALIAETALWMMDHIMNNRLSLAFGESYARIPLKTSPHIHFADALEIEWGDVLPPRKCSFVLGNPPFGGAKFQTEPKRAQVRRIAGLGGSGGTLDYVCAWFLKAGDYLRGSPARIGFVATNSITQGEQAAQLWPLLFDRCGLEISFAHRTFEWGSEAPGKAHVHVVIIGLTKREDEPEVKRLFSYDKLNGEPVESRHAALSPYLFDAGALADRHLVVEETTRPLSPRPPMIFGNMPNDDGGLILSADEAADAIAKEPALTPYIRPLLGADDFINGGARYCLWLLDAAPAMLRQSPILETRLARVKAYRLRSRRHTTRALANSAWLFGEIRHSGEPFLLAPRVSSERRDYVPLGFFDKGEIANDSCLFVPGASEFGFGILTSKMHMAWLRNIGGRLKSDFRYSIGVVYNTFPWPDADEKSREKIRALARKILDARAAHPESTLADLYDPDVMPIDLRKAHRALDAAVDRLYRAAPFASDRERVEHLFGLHEKLVAPLAAKAATKPESRRKR